MATAGVPGVVPQELPLDEARGQLVGGVDRDPCPRRALGEGGIPLELGVHDEDDAIVVQLDDHPRPDPVELEPELVTHGPAGRVEDGLARLDARRGHDPGVRIQPDEQLMKRGTPMDEAGDEEISGAIHRHIIGLVTHHAGLDCVHDWGMADTSIGQTVRGRDMTQHRDEAVTGLRVLPHGPTFSFDALDQERRRRAISIGTAADCDITIEHGTVAPLHCVLERRQSGVWIRDCGSDHGSRVNGVLVECARLEPGELITIGRVSLVVVGERSGSALVQITASTLAEFVTAANRAHGTLRTTAAALGLPYSTLRGWLKRRVPLRSRTVVRHEHADTAMPEPPEQDGAVQVITELED